MCGIAGVVGTQDQALITRMTAALRHRGPDHAGVYTQPGVQLGATRLSIIDLSAGSQPVFNESRRIAVVFNGEIYNHHALRNELRQRGHQFQTTTDTEVIVHLYEEDGERCLDRLHGMFAFAVLDGDTLLLARDRLGIKPLYYCTLADGGFIFASEIKAILRCRDLSVRLNTQALAHYLVLRHSVGAETYFEGISSLRPGHLLTVRCGDRPIVAEPRRYHAPDETRVSRLDVDGAEAGLWTVLRSAVQTHMAADVEVGVTLSGGLDSTVLALTAKEQTEEPLLTFSIGDDERNTDFSEAARLAARLGSHHRGFTIAFDEYVDAIPDMLAAEEKPSNLFGVPFFLLCRALGAHVKTCLHGEGADELFGGYEDYLDPDARLSHIRKRLPLLRELGVIPALEASAAIKRLSSAATMPEYLAATFALNFGDPLEQLHLIPVDKMGMAAGVELRVPYLDDNVHEFVNRLPIDMLVRSDLGVGKYLLKRLALKRFPDDAVDAVLRPKHGFPTAGMRHLARFDRLCEERLPDRYVDGHPMGRCFQSKRQLLLFDMFAEIFVTHRGDARALGSTMDFIEARRHGASNSALAETLS